MMSRRDKLSIPNCSWPTTSCACCSCSCSWAFDERLDDECEGYWSGFLKDAASLSAEDDEDEAKAEEEFVGLAEGSGALLDEEKEMSPG